MEAARIRLRGFEEARAADRAAREPMSDTAWAGVELAAVMPELVSAVERLSAAVERVRALHWPSESRDPACDCFDGLTVCPTMAALGVAP